MIIRHDFGGGKYSLKMRYFCRPFYYLPSALFYVFFRITPAPYR